MIYRITLFTLLFSLMSSPLIAQNSHHGFSVRAGMLRLNEFEIVQEDSELISISDGYSPAFSMSLRYNYFIGERFGFYAGYGVTRTNSRLLFRITSEGANGVRTSGSGPRFQNHVSHFELGGNCVQPINYRLDFIAEAGLQLAEVRWGGGSGNSSRSEGATMDFLSATAYSYDNNINRGQTLALQLSPGLRYQFSDHFYLTMRANFVFSNALLMENGVFELTSNLSPEPVSGTFQRAYSGMGGDLMMTYRF